MKFDTDLVIVGGGIAGIAAAITAQQRGLDYRLVEASERLGGKIETRAANLTSKNVLLEAGPESFVTRRPALNQLIADIGLAGQTIPARNEARGTYVLWNSRILEAPISPASLLATRLLSPRGKARMLLEPFIPKHRTEKDESLSTFATRRLGSEASERFIGPILSGIFNTNADTSSISVIAPVMRELERDYGSIFVASAVLSLKRLQKAGPRFITFPDGTESLVKAAAAQIRNSVSTGCPVAAIGRTGDGFTVVTEDAEITSRFVVAATPARVTADAIRDMSPEAAAGLNTLRTRPIGTISLVFHPSAVPAAKITGLMIPTRERASIDAVTFRQRAGYTVIRVYFGRGEPSLSVAPKARVLATALQELERLFGISEAPLASELFQWQSGYPQTQVGHLDIVAGIERELPAGLKLAGSPYRGISVADCIKQGRDAVTGLVS